MISMVTSTKMMSLARLLAGISPIARALLDAEAQLQEVREALDEVTQCQAPSLAQRIRDSFEHRDLVTDVVLWEAEKREQSLRVQITLWMELGLAVARDWSRTT